MSEINDINITNNGKFELKSKNNQWGFIDIYNFLNYSINNNDTNKYFKIWKENLNNEENYPNGYMLYTKNNKNSLISLKSDLLEMFEKRYKFVKEMMKKVKNILIINDDKLPNAEMQLKILSSFLKNEIFIENIKNIKLKDRKSNDEYKILELHNKIVKDIKFLENFKIGYGYVDDTIDRNSSLSNIKLKKQNMDDDDNFTSIIYKNIVKIYHHYENKKTLKILSEESLSSILNNEKLMEEISVNTDKYLYKIIKKKDIREKLKNILKIDDEINIDIVLKNIIDNLKSKAKHDYVGDNIYLKSKVENALVEFLNINAHNANLIMSDKNFRNKIFKNFNKSKFEYTYKEIENEMKILEEIKKYISMNNNKIITCPFCNYKNNNISEIEIHIEKEHEDIKLNTKNFKMKLPFKIDNKEYCPYCPYTILDINDNNMIKHIKLYHLLSDNVDENKKFEKYIELNEEENINEEVKNDKSFEKSINKFEKSERIENIIEALEMKYPFIFKDIDLDNESFKNKINKLKEKHFDIESSKTPNEILEFVKIKEIINKEVIDEQVESIFSSLLLNNKVVEIILEELMKWEKEFINTKNIDISSIETLIQKKFNKKEHLELLSAIEKIIPFDMNKRYNYKQLENRIDLLKNFDYCNLLFKICNLSKNKKNNEEKFIDDIIQEIKNIIFLKIPIINTKKNKYKSNIQDWMYNYMNKNIDYKEEEKLRLIKLGQEPKLNREKAIFLQKKQELYNKNQKLEKNLGISFDTFNFFILLSYGKINLEEFFDKENSNDYIVENIYNLLNSNTLKNDIEYHKNDKHFETGIDKNNANKIWYWPLDDKSYYKRIEFFISTLIGNNKHEDEDPYSLQYHLAKQFFEKSKPSVLENRDSELKKLSHSLKLDDITEFQIIENKIKNVIDIFLHAHYKNINNPENNLVINISDILSNLLVMIFKFFNLMIEKSNNPNALKSYIVKLFQMLSFIIEAKDVNVSGKRILSDKERKENLKNYEKKRKLQKKLEESFQEKEEQELKKELDKDYNIEKKEADEFQDFMEEDMNDNIEDEKEYDSNDEVDYSEIEDEIEEQEEDFFE